MIARRVLRDKYIKADVGITGANFAIAETGMISITENEGNARLTAALPRTMITLMGIEKVLPKLADLALFLPMLATDGHGPGADRLQLACTAARASRAKRTARRNTTSCCSTTPAPRLLADAEQRDALHCIRCGACLNVCPIFRNVGGHTYGTTYCGPIGSVITPHLRGLQDWKHLSHASSLCGACTEACPVKIDLHHHLLQNRRNASRQKPSWWEKIAFKAFAPVATRPALWSLVTKMGRLGQKLHGLVKGSPLDPAYAWTKTRDLPPIAQQTFKEWWRNSLMSDRDNILAVSERRWRSPPPCPARSRPTGAQTPVPPRSPKRRVLPAVGQAFEEELALFRQNAAELHADFRLCSRRDAPTAELRKSAPMKAGSARPRIAEN